MKTPVPSEPHLVGRAAVPPFRRRARSRARARFLCRTHRQSHEAEDRSSNRRLNFTNWKIACTGITGFTTPRIFSCSLFGASPLSQRWRTRTSTWNAGGNSLNLNLLGVGFDPHCGDLLFFVFAHTDRLIPNGMNKLKQRVNAGRTNKLKFAF